MRDIGIGRSSLTDEWFIRFVGAGGTERAEALGAELTALAKTMREAMRETKDPDSYMAKVFIAAEDADA